MTPLAAEWVEKAEGDVATAERELRARSRPNYDAACFHAQQAGEKYLKGDLQERDARIPRTHDLTQLLGMGVALDAAFDIQRAALILLDRYAVAYRYPGQLANRAEARESVKAMRGVRAFARNTLGLA